MKNLITYLSKKSLSLENGSRMVRDRFEIGSAKSRKSIGSNLSRISLASLICLCMLTVGVGNVWGAAATLPFYYDGNGGGSATGLTLSSIGNYTNSPKMKFDAANDYLTVQFSSAPAYVSFTFKQNGSNAGTFKVQQSTNGSSYTDVSTVTWPGNTKTSTIKVDLASTTRYVKLIMTAKGSNTNAGVGKLTIKARTSVTLDKNGGTSDGSVVVAYDAKAKDGTLTEPVYSGYAVTGYWEGASTGNKVLNADGTFAANNVSGWITSGKWSKDAATAKLYARWEATGCSNYSFHYGATANADGKNITDQTVECFSQVGSTTEWQLADFTIPTTTQYYFVGYAGYFYDSNIGPSGASNSGSERNQFKYLPVANLQGSSCGGTGDAYKHAAAGAHGKIRIYSDNSGKNIYAGFVPSGYQMRVGASSTWSNVQLTQSGSVWTSEIMDIDATLAAKNYYINVWTSGSYSSSDDGVAINNWTDGSSTISSMKHKTNSGDNWANGVTAGMRGYFRVWTDNCANNGYTHFVPTHRIVYHSNYPGGGGPADTYSVDVSVEETNSSIALASAPTAPTGYTFDGWYTAASGGTKRTGNQTISAGASADVELYAHWTEIVKNPVLSPTTGTYNADQSVSITCATTSAKIYYTITTDGTTPADPTESSTLYSGTITVDHTNTKIKAKAFKEGCVASSVVSATYTLTCATPAISVAAGTYTVAKDVTISSTTPGVTIRYTTDGTTPTASVGTIYSGPVHVDESMTLKAIAYKDNYNNSSVASAAYTMNIPATVTFVTGTGNPSVSPVTETSKGAGIELPAGPTPVCSVDGWEFAGWAESSCSETTKAPELFMPEDEISPESNMTMYAVYRKLTSGTSTATFAAANISNLTEHTVYPRDWRDNTGGVDLYIEDGQRYTGNASNPAAWNVTKSTAYTDHFALIDAHRKISSITIECTGASYMFASVDKDAGTAVLSTSSTTQTVTCSGNVTQVYLISNTSQQVRATSIAVTYYNAKFNSNPTCKDVKSIAITTAPTKITYCAGETFDPAGMEIRVTYTDDSSDDIAYDEHEGDFSFSPSTSTSLTTGNSSVTVTYREKDASQAITVNASRTISLTSSGSVTGGTFEADNTTACVGATITLTATPSEHYSLGCWTVTKSGGGTVTVTSNQFTMPDENVTVNATFTEDPYRTVVFKNSGSSLYSGDGFDATNKWKQKVYVGEAPVWPTALTDGTANDACDATSDKFYGWASNTWSGTLDDTDALDGWDGGNVYTSGPLATVVAGSGDIEYHAIWAEAVGVPSNEYQLVTSISQLNAGDKIVIAGAKTTSTYLLGYQRHTDAGYHFRPQSSNAYTITSSKVTLTSSDIAAIASDETHPYVLTLGKNGDYWTFYDAVNGGYLCATTADKNELNVRAEDSDGASRFTISISSDAASITSQVTPESTPHNLLQYLTNTFSCYKSTSGGTNPYIFRNLSTLGYQKFLTTCCNTPTLTFAASPYAVLREDIQGASTTTWAEVDVTFTSNNTTGTISVPDYGSSKSVYKLSAWESRATTGGTLCATDQAYLEVLTQPSGETPGTGKFHVKTTTGQTGQGTYRIAITQAATDESHGNFCETTVYGFVDVTLRDKFVDNVNGNGTINRDGHGAQLPTPTLSEFGTQEEDACHSEGRKLKGWIKETDLKAQYETGSSTRVQTVDGLCETCADGTDQTSLIVAPGANVTMSGATWYAVWAYEK